MFIGGDVFRPLNVQCLENMASFVAFFYIGKVITYANNSFVAFFLHWIELLPYMGNLYRDEGKFITWEIYYLFSHSGCSTYPS